ncbi:MAG TPA: cellulase family glycosylhydrolase, partial [Chitinophagaceae bacterium]
MKSLLLLLLFTFSLNLFAQPLRVKGKYIYNNKGEEVILRGIGLGGWMLQEPYMLKLSGIASTQKDIRKKIVALVGEQDTRKFYEAWLSNHCTKADIDSLAAWGFNSVRLPMHYNLFTLPIEDEPVKGENTWITKGFALTDSLLSWCKANKIYLILDLHAAPGGQGNDIAIADRDTTTPSLWQSDFNQQKTIALWEKLAARYASEEWLGGYDIINEPNWGFENPADKNGCAETKNIPLLQLMKSITAAIRKVDKQHIIFIEGNCWGNNYEGIFPPWDDNLVVSFHKYWNHTDQASIQKFLDYREQYNIPIWMGESGENSNAWFTSTISLLEKNKIGWTWWPQKKLGINNPVQVRINTGYNNLINYWKGTNEKPSKDDALKALMQLTEDLEIKNTIIRKDVIDAMFRQVQSHEVKPFKEHHLGQNTLVHAVDYDLGRIGHAYFDRDSGNYWVSTNIRTEWNKGWMYRNDGVDIEACPDSASSGYC